MEHGPRPVILQDVDIEVRAGPADLIGQACGDLLGLQVGDQHDALARRDPQACLDGVSRAGDEVLGEDRRKLGHAGHIGEYPFCCRPDQTEAARLAPAARSRPWAVSSQI